MLWVTWTPLLLSSSLFHPHLHISLLFFPHFWLISLLLFLFFQLFFVLNFRVCLVEWILGRLEKKKKKKRKKRRGNFLKGVWLGGSRGGRENVWWGPNVFSLDPPENRGEENHSLRLTKLPMCTVHMSIVPTPSPFFFFFFFFHLCRTCTIILAKKICYFFVCKYTIFLQKKKCSFFILLNGDIIVNLYKLHFSILSFFFSTKQISFLSFTFPSSQPNTNRRKLNIFYLLLIFYPPTFPLL